MNVTTENLDKLSLSESPSKSANSSSLSNNSAPKTPVSLLQELYVRKGITPKYDLVQIEGAVHEPTFKYRVSVGELLATGCGQSKKKAKHTAAKQMLDKLIALQQNQPSGNVSSIDSVGVIQQPKASKVVELPKDLDAELMSPHDDGINGNPVGDLQEMCMNRRLPPPVYEVGLEKGAPHERCFIIVCAVGGNLKESGSGKSKKLAKRQAAHKMLNTLKSMPVERDNEQSFAMIDEDDLAQGIARCKTSSNNKMDHQQVDSFFKFHRDLKVSRGPHLAGLHNSASFEAAQEDPEEFLDKISTEQDFFVTYVDVEEKSKDDKNHCFVQLSTNPVTVCFGIGQSPNQAKLNSAANALQYLRIMTK